MCVSGFPQQRLLTCVECESAIRVLCCGSKKHTITKTPTSVSEGTVAQLAKVATPFSDPTDHHLSLSHSCPIDLYIL